MSQLKVPEVVQKSWKAIYAFLWLVLANVAQVSTANGNVTLPTTPQEWGTLFVTTAIGTGLVWLKSNHPSVFEAQTKLEVAKNRVADSKQVR